MISYHRLFSFKIILEKLLFMYAQIVIIYLYFEYTENSEVLRDFTALRLFLNFHILNNLILILLYNQMTNLCP